MEYAVFLQILMELALSVSGEHELSALYEKASSAFHRKLDCTHILVLQEREFGLVDVFASPKWVKKDQAFYDTAFSLSRELVDSSISYVEKEIDNHFYYTFDLGGYGSLVIARGHELSNKLIRELEPILDMFATNILACLSFERQIQVEKELREQKTYIEYLAFHDPLTALPNRRMYLSALSDSLRKEEIGAVIMLDLDDFKGINDSLGHVFGDKVLCYIAGKLDGLSDESVFVSRFGGDEFQLLVRNKDSKAVEAFVKGMFKLFADTHIIEDKNVEIAFSMGITVYPADSSDENQLLMNADMALYAIKNHEKNDYRFYDQSLSAELTERISLESLIKKAIDNDGFKMVYQPQIDTFTGDVLGYEALLRFKNHPISPADFIPLAEANKMIIPIGRLVTEMVIKQLRCWIDEGLDVKPISINFSAVQIYDYTYITFMKELLVKYQINPKLLEIEITENIFVDNSQKTLELLDAFRKMGITISIDDFGVGYSSLSYLTFLPLDKIKLDRSIVVRFLEEDTLGVIKSIIDLAHSLNLQVVVEGVEHHYQWEFLSKMGCEAIQGFLFSKPLEVSHIKQSITWNYLSKSYGVSSQKLTLSPSVSI